MQRKSDLGDTFWRPSEGSWKVLEISESSPFQHPLVEWEGCIWIRKFKEQSLREIAGYQIAEVLGLPLQPWAAFFLPEPKDPNVPRSGAGILVEKWESYSWSYDLEQATSVNSALASAALALAVLVWGEWPRWMVDGSKSEMRLFDLEWVGPDTSLLPGTAGQDNYIASTAAFFDSACTSAVRSNVHEGFVENLRRLVSLKLTDVLDFSGHPEGNALKDFMMKGFERRQDQIHRLIKNAGLSGV